MKKKKRTVWRWLGLGILLVVAAACVLFYRADGGGAIPEVPGGFALRVGVLDADGQTLIWDVTDAEEIAAVQHYVRSLKAERLRPGAAVEPAYPFLGLSDGEGASARCAVFSGGVWADSAARRYAVALDVPELLSYLPGAQVRAGTLDDFPGRALAAAMAGTWDARLLTPAAPLGAEELNIRARERSEDKLFVTVHNPHETAVTVRTDVRLEVLLDGTWYTVPPKQGVTLTPETAALEPDATALFTASTKDTEARYGKLPAGHYRLVLLSYGAEFDVA